MESKHDALLATDLLLVVGVDQEGEHDPVHAQGGLHHVRDVSLSLEVVEVRKVPPRGLLVSG